MKRYLLILLGLLFFVSCSKDSKEEVSNSIGTKDEEGEKLPESFKPIEGRENVARAYGIPVSIIDDIYSDPAIANLRVIRDDKGYKTLEIETTLGRYTLYNYKIEEYLEWAREQHRLKTGTKELTSHEKIFDFWLDGSIDYLVYRFSFGGYFDYYFLKIVLKIDNGRNLNIRLLVHDRDKTESSKFVMKTIKYNKKKK